MNRVYAQTNTDWRNLKLGNSKPKDGTIGNIGCTITAIGNLHNIAFGTNYTPKDINELFVKHGVYVQDGWGYSIVNWQKVYKALPKLAFVSRDRNYNNATVWSWINIWPRMPVITVAYLSAKYPQHFVLFIGGGKMVDSLDGKVKPTGSYKTYVGSARFKKA